MKLYTFDLETYPNCFLFTGRFFGEQKAYVYEVSFRVNQTSELLQHLSFIKNSDAYTVGYNNLGFDYPILHMLLNEPYTFSAMKAYLKCQEIIGSREANFHSISLKNRFIPQIDLLKVNHFDNHAKRVGLKALQFAMRSESVEDLPFPVGIDLTSEQIDIMRSYNLHDVTETEKFLGFCLPHIQMRKELLDNGVISGDVLNYSDVKIGTEYLVKKIGRAKCYEGSQPKQTKRTSVSFKDIILPSISFRTERFNEVLEWFKEQKIWIDGEDKPKLEKTLAGLQFHFGLGGVHASVESKVFHSTDTHQIIDIDVAGMYVAVAVANSFYPEHLGTDFVKAYKQLQSDRKQYAKGSSMNLVLKLAGNGVFGNSNNHFSPFYDPKYTYSVTVNGQLQLLQLVELLSLIPTVEIIQANTDGVTLYMSREVESFFRFWKSHWENSTSLKLEEARFNRLWMRDVNNFIGEYNDGTCKRKGAYQYPRGLKDYWGGSGSEWHKDFSNLSAQKGIEQVLMTGVEAKHVVRCITNKFDFMLRYKVPSGAKVFIGSQEMSKTIRYYISLSGEPMFKIAMPKGEIGAWKRKNGLSDSEFKRIKALIPEGQWDERIHTKNKSKYKEVETSIESGRLVKCCNNVKDFNWDDLDYTYYESEINKLKVGDN